MSTTNVMIVGVGGQGSLLASRLLGHVMLKKGYDVKISEVHGMSQRGGSVVTYVRFGSKVYSPIITRGEADYIISFEVLEAARYMEQLKPGGQVIVSNQRMDPMPVITGAAEYPKDLFSRMELSGAKVDKIDALGLALRAGNAKAANVVLMGRFSNYFSDVTEDEWLEALDECVPAKFGDLNRTAFYSGRNA
jgi:indolepyruvate ferredoxin oxidoreductase beta subunit